MPKRATTFAPLHQQLAEVDKERDQLDKQIPTTLVSKRNGPTAAGLHPEARRVRSARPTGEPGYAGVPAAAAGRRAAQPARSRSLAGVARNSR